MWAFPNRLCHEEMVEWVAMANRKRSKRNQMRIGCIESLEPLIRQNG